MDTTVSAGELCGKLWVESKGVARIGVLMVGVVIEFGGIDSGGVGKCCGGDKIGGETAVISEAGGLMSSGGGSIWVKSGGK